jgi:hypothetical protein
MIGWEECDGKLKTLRKLLEHDPPRWTEAGQIRNEIIENGPKGKLQLVEEGQPLPSIDFDQGRFAHYLVDLGKALARRDKAAALETLSEIGRTSTVLKRRAAAKSIP